MWPGGAPPAAAFLGPLPAAGLALRVNPDSLKGPGWADSRPLVSLRPPRLCVDGDVWTHGPRLLSSHFKSVWAGWPVTGLHRASNANGDRIEPVGAGAKAPLNSSAGLRKTKILGPHSLNLSQAPWLCALTLTRLPRSPLVRTYELEGFFKLIFPTLTMTSLRSGLGTFVCPLVSPRPGTVPGT